MILIVTYDLRTPKDYHEFYEAIKAQGEQGKWWHYMASTWLLSTNKTPQAVADALRPHMDNQDLLFVCELNANYQGYLPKSAWDWIIKEFAPSSPYLPFLTSATAFPPPPAPGAFSSLADLLKTQTKSDKPPSPGELSALSEFLKTQKKSDKP